jgi:hypothetical protein
MSAPRDFLLLVTWSLATATPAVAQTSAPIPDLSGLWNHPSLNGLELPLSGPGPVRNLSRVKTGSQAGAGNIAQLVGDHTNPILQPWAAEVVRKFGEMSLAGIGFPTPRNQCWPEQVPFVFITPDLAYKGKALQLEVTIEDSGAFTTPWSATVTLRRARDERLELVCAENTQWYPGTPSAVPTADKPDF